VTLVLPHNHSRTNHYQIEESNEEELEEESNDNNTFASPESLLGSFLGMMPQGNPPNTRSYRFQSGNGSASITFQSTTYNPGNGPGTSVNPTASPDDPLNLALNQLFHGLGRRTPGFQAGSPHEDGDNGPVSPFPLFNFILGGGMPGGSRPGDVAWTQEEFDRIMSQLMDHSHAGAPGATQDAITTLPKVKVDQAMLGESNKAECTICMDEVELDEEVTRLYCKHWFHTNCISFWLKEHNTCPHCRKSIEDARKEAEDAGEIPKSAQPSSSSSNPQASTSYSVDQQQNSISRTTPLDSHSTLRQTFEDGASSTTASFQRPWEFPTGQPSSGQQSPWTFATGPQAPSSPYEPNYQRPNRDPMEDTSSARPRSNYPYPNSPSELPSSFSRRSSGMRRDSNSPPLRDSDSGYLSRHHDSRSSSRHYYSRTEEDHQNWREPRGTPRRRERDSNGHLLDEHGNRIPARNIRTMHQRPGRPIPRDLSTLSGRELDREVMMQQLTEYDRQRQAETERHNEDLRRHLGGRSSSREEGERDRDRDRERERDRDGGSGGNLFAAARRLFGGSSSSGGGNGNGNGSG
jgi:hypothetical protein